MTQGLRCKHGMIPQTCGLCQPPPQAQLRRPVRSASRRVSAAAAVEPARTQAAGFTIVHSTQKNHPTHDHLRPGLRAVHIHGHPFLWMLQLILERAPDVQTIQMIPYMFRKLGPPHHALCQARAVKLVAGHARPDLAWAEGEVRPSGSFLAQKQFLETLSGDQRALWEELVGFGFEEAEMAQRYYALGTGEAGETQEALGTAYGFSQRLGNHVVSQKINGLLLYLDPSFHTSQEAAQVARGLSARVARVRTYFSAAEAEQQTLDRLGLQALPQGMPRERAPVLKALLLAQQSGALAALRGQDQRLYDILTRRYGLGAEGRFLTLAELGRDYGTSREWIRQLEARALRRLGIEDGGAHGVVVDEEEAVGATAPTPAAGGAAP